MADLYYGYAERNASDEINWAQIGKNVTDMLKQETDIREQKKAAIDEATRKYGQTLANGPQGEHQGVNQWWLTYADNAQKAMLLQERLLKSGQLKPKDYFVMRQNLIDGTKEATSLIKDYQEEYKTKMDRWKNNKSAKKEQWLMAEAEAFGNFNQSELYINPTNFAVNVAKKEKRIVDGKEVYVMSENPNNFTTVNAMRNRIKGTFDRFNVIENLKPGVDALGKDVNTIIEVIANTGRGGVIKTIKDITQRPDFGAEVNNSISLFERAESNYIKSLMVNPDDAASVLTDYIKFDPKSKEEYVPTWNEKEAGGRFILQKNDSSGRPISVLTKDQEAEVEKALRAQFRTMLDREIERKTTPQVQAQYAPSYVYERGDKQREEENALNLWQQIYTATTTGGKTAAKQGLLGSPNAIKQGLIDIDVSDGQKIKFIYSDKSKNREFEIADKEGNALVSPEQWAAFGTELHGVIDPKRYSKFAGQQFGTKGVDWENISGGRTGTKDPNAMYGSYIGNKINPSVISISTDNDIAEKETLAKVKPLVQALGFEAVIPQTPLVQGKFIQIKGNGKTTGNIDLSKPAEAIETIQSFLLANVPGKTETEKMMYLSGLAKKGVFDEQSKSSPTPTPEEVKKRIGGY